MIRFYSALEPRRQQIPKGPSSETEVALNKETVLNMGSLVSPLRLRCLYIVDDPRRDTRLPSPLPKAGQALDLLPSRKSLRLR